MLDNIFSIGKLGTPVLAPPGAAMFLFDDLFLPFGTFVDVDALWEPVVALKTIWLPWACPPPLFEGIVRMAVWVDAAPPECPDIAEIPDITWEAEAPPGPGPPT